MTAVKLFNFDISLVPKRRLDLAGSLVFMPALGHVKLHLCMLPLDGVKHWQQSKITV